MPAPLVARRRDHAVSLVRRRWASPTWCRPSRARAPRRRTKIQDSAGWWRKPKSRSAAGSTKESRDRPPGSRRMSAAGSRASRNRRAASSDSSSGSGGPAGSRADASTVSEVASLAPVDRTTPATCGASCSHSLTPVARLRSFCSGVWTASPVRAMKVGSISRRIHAGGPPRVCRPYPEVGVARSRAVDALARVRTTLAVGLSWVVDLEGRL